MAALAALVLAFSARSASFFAAPALVDASPALVAAVEALPAAAVACRVALILRDGVRLLDPLALRPRAEPRRREFVFLLVFFCSCAITFLGFLLWCLCSVMQGRRAGNPYAAFRAYSSPAARMPSSALSS